MSLDKFTTKIKEINRETAFILVFVSYYLAIVSAIGLGYLLRDLNPILMIFLVDILATLIIFIISTVFRNASFYDPFWSFIPIVIALYLLFTSSDLVNTVRQYIVVLMVCLWGLRLTWNWVRQWRGINHEDWRYVNFRKKYVKSFWFINLTGIQLMPTILVFFGCLSLFPALNSGTNNFQFLDYIALIITLGAIILETFADFQMKNFMKTRKDPQLIMDKGLWGKSRHPNYLGEMLFWWGLYLFGVSADPQYWWVIFGPIAITILFLFISIPMMEKRQEHKSEYKNYKLRVRKLIPRFSFSS
ncbi:DUF1295 domain-containing protein [Promethearchaeum syntrophicum]|uniref:DUF1295 domain-containing protein n=1 Tax=Promethearchaeum syntrophicum TaxID=2594042 RepID=A0A5B9DAT2_9ARCH|nr:DUF1295 domain-containing protein [Candidatus Prometheoarchaeum syntrophicum]QEE16253.1 hypothetical protein DSAG12_02083 [Candidatus Prometheoarchaeum syntrophicum]